MNAGRIPTRVAVVTVSTALAVPVLGACAGRALSVGAYGDAVLLSVGALLAGVTAGFAWVYRGRPLGVAARSVRARERALIGFGTRIDGDPVVFVLARAGAACALALAWGGAAHTAVVDGAVAPVAALLVLGAAPAWFLAETSLGGIRNAALTVAADGIRVRSWTVETYVPWTSVRGVQPWRDGIDTVGIVLDDGAAVARRRTTRLRLPAPVDVRTVVVVDPRPFDAATDTVVGWLDHYRRTAPDRRELGTDAARLRLLGHAVDLAAPRVAA